MTDKTRTLEALRERLCIGILRSKPSADNDNYAAVMLTIAEAESMLAALAAVPPALPEPPPGSQGDPPPDSAEDIEAHPWKAPAELEPVLAFVQQVAGYGCVYHNYCPPETATVNGGRCLSCQAREALAAVPPGVGMNDTIQLTVPATFGGCDE